MHSNFEFLNKDILTEQFYKRASEAELSYVMGLYSNVLVSVRAVAENIAKDVADQNYLKVGERETFDDILQRLKQGQYISKYALQFFYDIKGSGNVAAHSLQDATQQEGLLALKHLYALAVWFVNDYYDGKVDPTDFREPQKEEYLYQTTTQPVSKAEKILFIFRLLMIRLVSLPFTKVIKK